MATTKRRSRAATAVPRSTVTDPSPNNAPHVPTADELLVGPTDVSLMLGVPVSWVYAKSEAGELPSYKLGHYRRFKWSEIEEYLRARRSNGK